MNGNSAMGQQESAGLSLDAYQGNFWNEILKKGIIYEEYDFNLFNLNHAFSIILIIHNNF